MRPARALGLSLALAVAACALPSPARAAASDDSVTRKKVQTYLDLAADLFKSGDFEGALAELRRAETLSELAVVRYNIARCLEELKRDAEAIAAFQKYLSLKDTNEGAAERQKRAQEAVARLSARSFGIIEVSCPVEGSSVLIVGVMQVPEQCPWKAEKIAPGTYEVQTFSPGYPPYSARAQVRAGETVTVVGQGGAAPQRPAQADSQPQASAIAPTVANPAGPLVPDSALATASAPASPVRPLVEVRSTTYSTGKIVGGTLLGVLGVGAVVGFSYFLYDGHHSTERIQDGGLETAEAIQDAADRGSRDNVLAGVFGVVSGCALIPAIVLLATSGTTTTTYQPSAVSVSPAAFPSGGGVVLSGALP